MHPFLIYQNYLGIRSTSTSNRTGTRTGTRIGTPRPRQESEGLLRRMLRKSVSHIQRRKMINALEAMDDRMLKDIGIYRANIHQMVHALSDSELRMRPVARAERRPAHMTPALQAA